MTMNEMSASLIPSACLIAARPALVGKGFEVLLAKRGEGLALAPGHYVFPGGALETIDDHHGASEEAGYRRAALREFSEEVGVGQVLPLAIDQLVFLGEWITPTFLPKRYQTRFYLAKLMNFEPVCDDWEIVEALWASPEQLINGHTLGKYPMMFPTLAILDWLAASEDLDALFTSLEKKALASVCPTLINHGERRFLTLGPSSDYRIQRWSVD